MSALVDIGVFTEGEGWQVCAAGSVLYFQTQEMAIAAATELAWATMAIGGHPKLIVQDFAGGELYPQAVPQAKDGMAGQVDPGSNELLEAVDRLLRR